MKIPYAITLLPHHRNTPHRSDQNRSKNAPLKCRIKRKEIHVAQRRHIIVMNEAGHPPFYMEFKHEDSWGLQTSLRDFSDAKT